MPVIKGFYQLAIDLETGPLVLDFLNLSDALVGYFCLQKYPLRVALFIEATWNWR